MKSKEEIEALALELYPDRKDYNDELLNIDQKHRVFIERKAFIKSYEIAQPKWISVKDRLPDTLMGNFICCLKNEAIIEMSYSSFSDDRRWFKTGFGDEHPNNPVTHWMPLPKPPTK